jgi:hypothetical protein
VAIILYFLPELICRTFYLRIVFWLLSNDFVKREGEQMKKVRNAEIIIENNDNKASGNIYKEFIVLMKDIIEDIKNKEFSE